MARHVSTPPLKNVDLKMAERFHYFRKKYVDENMVKAADKIGISKTWISNVESGQRPINNLKVVNSLITKFGLNQEWLATGQGDEKKEPQVSTETTKIRDVHQDVVTIERSLKILQNNINKMFDILEKQNKIIEQLNGRIENLEGKRR